MQMKKKELIDAKVYIKERKIGQKESVFNNETSMIKINLK